MSILARMRDAVAALTVAATLGGCSLIYDPSNIPSGRGDAPIDPPIDARPDAEVIVDSDPGRLELTSVAPAEIFEGAGGGGSRPVVLLIEGTDMASPGTTVAITANAAATKTPMLLVDTASVQIDGNGHRLAVAVALPVDSMLTAADSIPLDVTVTKPVAAGPPLVRKLEGMVVLKGLPELDGAAPAGGLPASSEYSIVNVTSGTLRGMAGLTEPVRLVSRSSMTIAAAVTVTFDASGRTPGPAGGAGGMGGAAGGLAGNPGMAGGGPEGGVPSGGAGRFTAAPQLTTLENPNRSSGGAGGQSTTLQAGADGGGGGGSVVLHAAGDLTVGGITARGAAGGTTGANPGGGGSGGVVWLRAGRHLTAGALDAAGVPNAGKVRFDAGGTASVVNAGNHHRGPMFVNMPSITTLERPTVMVSGQPLTQFSYFITNAAGSEVRGPAAATTANNGLANVTLAHDLFPGINDICLLVEGAPLQSSTRTCIQVVHLYRP